MDYSPISGADAARIARLSDQAWKTVDASGLHNGVGHESLRQAMGFTDRAWIMDQIGATSAMDAITSSLQAVMPTADLLELSDYRSNITVGSLIGDAVITQAFGELTLAVDTSTWFTHAADAIGAIDSNVWASITDELPANSAFAAVIDTPIPEAFSPALHEFTDTYSQIAGETPALSALVDSVQRQIFQDFAIPHDVLGLDRVETGITGLNIPLPGAGAIDRILELLEQGAFDTDEFDEFFDEAMENAGWRGAIRTAGAWIAARGQVSKEVGQKVAVVLLWTTVWSILYVLYLIPFISAGLSASGVSAPQVMDKLKDIKDRRRGDTESKDGDDDPDGRSAS
ncbi:hypothetical protein NXT08_24725 (plasmid) [Rhodococcus pyridinivorans]|uniref:hypothetical protein n=1 Tax=Rhodococcus pyridinivorans TaxID=103816 RepID=UPI00216488FB|nr:hypothetical protein [Rhodococcus pyridinivorans]UVT27705.1 hypothetical protein NXT08_24725 [Rhodococcus pyridinivorans]